MLRRQLSLLWLWVDLCEGRRDIGRETERGKEGEKESERKREREREREREKRVRK